MLRSFDEKGGVGVYSQNIVKELLSLDRNNEYVLFYQRPQNIGCFSHYQNVTEQLIAVKNKMIWDQVAIPLACWWKNVDVIFHPKFTAPLLAPSKAVMTVHGADWLIPEQAQYYSWLDVHYMRLFLPLYIKKCSAVISVSQLTTDNFNDLLDLAPNKMRTVYFGPARHFQRESDPGKLHSVREKYALPEHFILTLSKRAGDNRKNLGQIFKAYAQYHQIADQPYKLVVGGKDCHLFRQDYAIPNDGFGRDILFPGWIDQKDLPAVYSQAGLYLYPSNLEAFPIPLTEAMACGTPIITSDANGLREIAGDAAVFVNPQDSDEIAQAISRVLGDPELQAIVSERGLIRSRQFGWEKCARETLSILERVYSA